MTGVLYRLARFSVRHRFAVLALWILMAVALVGVSHHLGDNTNDSVTLPGTNSQQASDALSKSFDCERRFHTFGNLIHARRNVI